MPPPQPGTPSTPQRVPSIITSHPLGSQVPTPASSGQSAAEAASAGGSLAKAYQALTTAGYSPSAALSASQQIAAGGAVATFSGPPSAAQQAALDAQNHVNPSLGPSLAPSVAPSSYTIQNGYWVNASGQNVAKVNPAGFLGNGPNSSNMLPL